MSEINGNTHGSGIEAGPSSFTEKEIRGWRNEIDRMIAVVEVEFLSSREISLCRTQFQRAKAWLGEALKEMGTQNLYPNSSNPENKTIERQAEHGEMPPLTFQQYDTQLERVKALRGVIQDQIDAMRPAIENAAYANKVLSSHALIEAKHWLGWELDRIRREQEGGTVLTQMPKSLY